MVVVGDVVVVGVVVVVVGDVVVVVVGDVVVVVVGSVVVVVGSVVVVVDVVVVVSRFRQAFFEANVDCVACSEVPATCSPAPPPQATISEVIPTQNTVRKGSR